MTGFNFLDLPQYINSAVLGGNSLWVAQMSIDVVLIFFVLVTLLILKATIMQVFLVEFMVIGVLTGLGWMTAEILVSMVAIIALGLTTKLAPIFLGGKEAS